ncbi:MAG TPA: cbb3-type cytochrome oxidase assembly protein CcoS [Glaciecola sp.]|jgi:cbb3-type cytochrome oxidase maturation protein|nr:cbb3-type cytochrome oxidase assembly protein CcoS [Glaciecola sp.]
MNVIYVLIPIAIIIVAIALLVFFWAVKANQFDDLERQGSAILFDDDVADIVTPAPQAAAEPKSPSPSTTSRKAPDTTSADHKPDSH